MKSAEVVIAISKNSAIEAILRMTTDDRNFDPDPWSIYDAEILERAAAMIRREIAEAEANRSQARASARAGVAPA